MEATPSSAWGALMRRSRALATRTTIEKPSGRVFYAVGELDWAAATEEIAPVSAERCMVLCIGDGVETGTFASVAVDANGDLFSIAHSIASIARRWLDADQSNCCLVAAMADFSRVSFDRIMTCCLYSSEGAMSAEDALLAMCTKKTLISRLTKQAPTISPSSRAFLAAYDTIRRSPEPYLPPAELYLQCVTVHNLPQSRLLVLLTQGDRILFASMQLGPIVYRSGSFRIPINCQIQGGAVIKGYHVPELMSIDSPRRPLFRVEVHTGAASCNSMVMEFPCSLIDRVPASMTARFGLSAEFGEEPRADVDNAEPDRSDFAVALGMQDTTSSRRNRAVNEARQRSFVPPNLYVHPPDEASRRLQSFVEGTDPDENVANSELSSYRSILSFGLMEEIPAPPTIPLERRIVQGATARQLARLPIFRLAEGSALVDQCCLICTQEFAVNDALLTLPCLHFMHTNCITEWLRLKATCPVCYTPLSLR